MKHNQIVRRARLVLLLVAMAAFVAASVGCNTAHGFGKDMENAGEKIKDGTK